MKDDQFYKSWKKIGQGKEAEGYVEWKKDVVQWLTNMDDDTRINYMKRCERRVKQWEHEKDNGFYGLLSLIITVVITQITLLVTIYNNVQVVSMMIAEATENSVDIGINNLKESAELMGEVSIGLIAIMLVILFAGIAVWLISRHISNKELYYQDIVEIIKEVRGK